VPLVVRWPGVLRAGAVSDRVGLTMDLTASIARAAGAKASRPLDGVDLLDDEARGRSRDRTLFWRARRGDRTWRAVRDGSLKYVEQRRGDRAEEHLFDLAADPGEKSDLLPARATDAERLRAKLAAWEAEVRPSR
jgi:arylsulfatase A-like enzyme